MNTGNKQNRDSTPFSDKGSASNVNIVNHNQAKVGPFSPAQNANNSSKKSNLINPVPTQQPHHRQANSVERAHNNSANLGTIKEKHISATRSVGALN